MEIVIMSEEERYNNRQIERLFDEQDRRSEKRIENQSLELKEHLRLTIDPLTQQVMKTNGTVKWQTKVLYMAIGALVLLMPWAGWVTTSLLAQSREEPLTRDDVENIIDNRIVDY